MRLFALLAMLLLSHPAWALDTCLADSIGGWRGPVFDRGHLQHMDSEFHFDGRGGLAGSYRIGVSEPYEGTLAAFRQTAPCEADFTWSDPSGVGVVHIRFHPQSGRYDGLWGTSRPVRGYFFNGRRTRPPAIS